MTSNSGSPPQRVKVRLKARASLTRERTEEVVEITAPRTREGQINGLVALVKERFPGATLRVFHEGAGSFTKDDLHVVAAYQDLDRADRPTQASDDLETGEDDGFPQLPLTA